MHYISLYLEIITEKHIGQHALLPRIGHSPSDLNKCDIFLRAKTIFHKGRILRNRKQGTGANNRSNWSIPQPSTMVNYMSLIKEK